MQRYSGLGTSMFSGHECRLHGTRRRFLTTPATGIMPISAGSRPRYNPASPSCATVSRRQCRIPLYCPTRATCRPLPVPARKSVQQLSHGHAHARQQDGTTTWIDHSQAMVQLQCNGSVEHTASRVLATSSGYTTTCPSPPATDPQMNCSCAEISAVAAPPLTRSVPNSCFLCQRTPSHLSLEWWQKKYEVTDILSYQSFLAGWWRTAARMRQTAAHSPA